MPFVPVDEEEIHPEDETDKEEPSSVQKAKDDAEIQKYKTEEVEAKQRAVFAENNIEDTEDLQVKIQEVSERESVLTEAVTKFENEKSVRLLEIQKKEAELEKEATEFNKSEQWLLSRIKDVEVREAMATEREELLSSVERQKLKEQEEYNSLVEQLKRGFSQIISLLGNNADILIKTGFRKLGNDLWDEIEQMERWSKNGGIDNHCDTIVEWMKGEVDDCNKKAVEMARNPKQYNERNWNKMVDNLEVIYKAVPALKPEYLPKDEDVKS